VKILASCGPGEVRVAAWDGTALVDFALWRPGAPDGVGDVHRGRLLARMPALAGSFVAIAGAEGFLPDSEGGNVPEGSMLTVRISRAAQGGKGPRLSAKGLEPATPGAPALLRRGPSAVERLAALHQDAPVLVDDAAVFAALRPLLGARLERTARAFDDDVEDQVAALASSTAELPGGARMHVYPTPALTAIDLDLGGLAGGKTTKRAAHEAANRAAIPALARQIRLRNLAGAIVVDLAGLSPKRRAALASVMHDALADDPMHPRFLGFSALGLAEILRPRVHPPLHELLGTAHALGLAGLRALAGKAASRPGTALALHAPPAIIQALRDDVAARDDITRLTGRPLALVEAPSLPSWRIIPA
jgi:Ribonuclease G/E